MKNYLFLPVLLFIVFACGSNKTEPEVLPVAETTMWNIDMDSTGNLVKKQVLTPEIDSLSPENVIAYLNNNNPAIKLVYNKVSGDTLFIKIPDATHLTQQMGSAGPEVYMAEAVYNCTEIPGIKYVTFDFEEGDHAQPGTYKREDFNTVK
jgi:hypothetical protein